jgi:hypothetical protein
VERDEEQADDGGTRMWNGMKRIMRWRCQDVELNEEQADEGDTVMWNGLKSRLMMETS